MSNKILVTGATGKVGSQVVKQLAAKGVPVRAGFHNPAKANDLSEKGVEVVHFDYSDPASVKAALEGVDKLFLMAPPVQTDPIGIEKQLVDLAKEAGVTYIVKLSAAGVENNEATPLRVMEKYIEASGIPYTFLRPTWFNQNFSTGQADNIRQGTLPIPAADGKVGFIDVRDIAAVAVTALTEEGHANKAYTLTGSDLLDHYQVAEALSKALDKEVKYVALTDEEFLAQTKAEGWPQEIAEVMSNLYSMIRQGWTAFVTPTVSQVLGRPPISFAQFAQDYANVWK